MEIPPFEVCPGCRQTFILPVYRCAKCGYEAKAGDAARNAPVQTANPSPFNALFAPPVDGTKPITGFPADKPDSPTSGIIGKLLIAAGIGAVAGLRFGDSSRSFSPVVGAACFGFVGLAAGTVLVMLDIANANIQRAQQMGLSAKRWKALQAFAYFLIFLSVIPLCLIVGYLTMP